MPREQCTDRDSSVESDPEASHALRLRMLERMFVIRAFENQANELYRSARMPGLTHLYIGEEAVAVGVCSALRRDDTITSTHRGTASATIHVGIAVAIDDGLIVPVIHDADRLALCDVVARRAELVQRAHAGTLRPEDVAGGTFTISNLGMFGIDAFQAIVTAPQGAILAVGRIADRIVAVEGVPAVRPTLVLTLSLDHRIVDGATGARFLDTLASLLEEPAGLVR